MEEPSVDQEKALDLAIKNIKYQAYQIYLTIEKNNLRFCLKKTKLMLNELRTDKLTPKSYFQLYIEVFNEVKKVEAFMKAEISRGRRPEDIYESVQQCEYVIPRLYLTIIAASIYIEKYPSKCKEILDELLEQVKSSQNPIRGIFTRYFLLQMIKDKLPDNNNIYVKEKGGNFLETICFLIKNMEEINRLWIRISLNASDLEKQNKIKEREDLKPLINETINRLSTLEGLTLELYENEVLPKLMEIIFMYNDHLSQEYIMECIIRAFPVEYNIKCMEFILLSISKLNEGANIKLLFSIMLVKLTLFVENARKLTNEEEKKQLISSAYNVFPILMRNFDIIINNELKVKRSLIVDVLEFDISFMKYCTKCAPEKEILNSINHILNLGVEFLSISRYQTLFKNDNDKICELLSIPLESIYSLFDMPDFPKLLNCLDYDNMKIIGINIINNLINPNSHEKIDSVEKINKLLTFIRPFLNNIKSPEEEKEVNFEKEQNGVAKLIFAIRTENPQVLLDIYSQLKNIFYEGGINRRKITFPALANALIYFSQQLSLLYDNKNEEKKDTTILYDISKLENDDNFYEFLSKIYDLLAEILKVMEEEFPQMGVKLNLLLTSQIDNIKSAREKFEEKSLLFFNNSIKIYNSFDKEKRFDYFCEICQNLIKITIFSQKNLENIIKDLINETKILPKRVDQFNGLLMISQIYYKHFKDGKKVLDCLNKAKKIADFSLTNPSNLILYIFLLNKYIYYIDVDKDNIVGITNEQVEDLIEAIKNHIITIKTDKNIDSCFLPEIEKYFKNTENLIRLRKNEKNHKTIYDSITITE